MEAEKHVGRIAGLAVSFGIGITVAVGGIGVAAAEPADSSLSDRAHSGSRDTPNGSDDSTGSTRSADRESTRTADRTEDTASGQAASYTGKPKQRELSSQSESEPESMSRTEAESATEADESATDADAEPDIGVPAAIRRPSSVSPSHRETADKQEFSTALRTDRPQVQDTVSPSAQDAPTPRRQAPVSTQALSAVLGAARRPSEQPLAAAPAPEAVIERPAVVTNALVEEPDSASISPMNTAPTATAAAAAPNGITGVTQVTVTASDIDDDALTYTASRPIWGWVSNFGDGNFTYSTNGFVRFLARFIPAINSDRFSVTVSDGRGGATSVNVNTTIVPLNSAPVLRSRNVGTPDADSGAVTGSVKAADPNWDSLSYVGSTTVTEKGTVSVNGGGGFTYTPTAAARHAAASNSATTADKTDAFTVRVVDKYGAATEIPVTIAISPVNAAPTGISSVGSPDAVSGIATGSIVAEDPDSDVLTYSGSTTTLKGTLVVAAAGNFTYTPTAEARYNAWQPNATASDLIDEVAVTVDDGHGGVISVPIRVEISPSGEAPPNQGLSTFCGCTLMPAGSIFHADIGDLPLLPESAKFIEILGGSRDGKLKSDMGAKEWMGSTGDGMPVNIVEASHPKETVVFNRGYSTSGPGIDDRPYAIPDYPLVEGMPSVPAWDRHLFVFQKGTCISQELNNVAHGFELPAAGILDALGNAAYAAIWGDRWIAGAGAQYDMSSPFYPEKGHANASRLPFLPMMLRPDDLERGEIDHMLGFVIAANRGAGFTWPARAGDGTSPDGIPMGTVFRLSSDFDITPYSRATQIILRGLQVRGAVVYDSGPDSDGARLLAMSTGWTGTEHIEAARELNTIPIHAFEAVDVSSIAVDPSVGWQIH